MGVPFLKRMTASMWYFIDEDAANHCSSRMLSDVLHDFNPDVIPSVAAAVASILCQWTHHSIQRHFNSVELEVRLDIIELVGEEEEWNDLDEEGESDLDEEEEEECSDLDEGEEEEWSDLDEQEDDDDDADIEEDVLASVTTESLNSGGVVSDGLFGSLSADEVKALFNSWRAQTWDSKTRCSICWKSLGAAGGFEEEEEDGDEKGCKEEEKEVRICQLPCNHLFHEKCIKLWFKEGKTCPHCRNSPCLTQSCVAASQGSRNGK